MLCWGVPAGSVFGEVLVDPTRPPSQASTGSDPGAGAAEAGPRIRSIVISPRRRFAVVDGRRVEVGDVVGESEVTAIEPGGIRLLGPEGEQWLSLYRVPVAKRLAGGE